MILIQEIKDQHYSFIGKSMYFRSTYAVLENNYILINEDHTFNLILIAKGCQDN